MRAGGARYGVRSTSKRIGTATSDFGRCSPWITRGWSCGLGCKGSRSRRWFFSIPLYMRRTLKKLVWLRSALPVTHWPKMNEAPDFDNFYRTWWVVVYDGAYKVLLSGPDAEDIAQTVFLRLWRKGSWRSIDHPWRYFREAGRREALSALRSRRNRAPVLPLNGPLFGALHSLTPLPDADLMRAERRRLAARLIAHLPPRCRLVCALVFLEGLPHREVAERLDITVKAVEKNVARGRDHLRKMVACRDRSSVSTFGSVGR